MINGKNLLCLLSILVVFQFGYSQLINLEMNTDRIEIDTTNHNNIWQIGQPAKAIFDSAYSFPKAMLTDTQNSYPVNNKSSFLIGFDLQGFHPKIGFWHKFDTDANLDGGYVEVSFDQGSTWLLLADTIADSNGGEYGTGVYGLYVANFYGGSDSLYNGLIGFNGLQADWIYSTIEFPCLAVKKSFPFFVKFTFISDSIETNKEGWMIDDILIYNAGYCTGINEVGYSSKVSVSPNPFSKKTTLQVGNDYTLKNGTLTVMDFLGRPVVKYQNIDNNSVNIEKGDLRSGVYFYNLSDMKNLIGTGKLIIQ